LLISIVAFYLRHAKYFPLRKVFFKIAGLPRSPLLVNVIYAAPEPRITAGMIQIKSQVLMFQVAGYKNSQQTAGHGSQKVKKLYR
jgi:hypothetical protein